MKLPEIQQIAFQGSAQTLEFDPVQIPDPNPRIQADLASIAKSFSNMQASAVQRYEGQKQQAKQMEQLFEFIPKAAQDIYKIQDEAREATAKAVAAEVLLNTDPEKIKEQLSEESAKRLAQEKPLEEAAVQEASAASKEPGNSELSSLFLNYKGKQRRHIQIGLAKLLGVTTVEWVAEQRKSNSGRIYLPGLQKSVRINDKNLPPSVAEQVRQELMKSAMGIGDISGKNSIDLGILAEHGMPLMRNNMLQLKQREDRTWRSTNGHNQRMMLERQFNNDLETIINNTNLTAEQRYVEIGKLYQTHITSMGATTPLNGDDRGIGVPGAVDNFMNSMVARAEAGERTYFEELAESVVGPNGEKFKEFYTTPYNKLKVSLQEAENKEFRNRMGSRQRSVKQQVLSFLQFIKENEGEITFEAGAAQVKFLTEQAQAAGLTPAQAGVDQIQGQLLMYGEGSAERQDLIASAQADAMTGRLSVSHPLFSTAIGRTHPLYEQAKRNDANNITEEHKSYKDVITDIVSANLGSAKNLYGELKGVGGQIVNEIYAQDLSNFNRDLEATTTPEERRQVLANWTKRKTEELNKAFTTGSGNLLELDANKRPFRWYNQAAQAGTKTEQMTNQLAQIVSVAKSNGNVYKEIQDNPGSLVARDRALTDMGKLLSGQPIGDYYAVAQEQINKAAGKEIVKSPMDLLAAVYRSYEPNSFDAEQIEQAVRMRDQLPAAQKNFFDRYQKGEYVNPKAAILSSNQSTRSSFDNRVPQMAMTDKQLRSQIASIVRESSGSQTKGVDVVYNNGVSPAYFPGVVKNIGEDFRAGGAVGFGHYVIIEHTDPSNGKKFDGIYSHLAEPSTLQPGQRVSAGQSVGKQGSTGRTVPTGTRVSSFDALKAMPPNSLDMTPYEYGDALITELMKRLTTGN